jgi:hypothetical protein
MLRMISYPHRPKSGHFTCYLNRTYHVLPTNQNLPLDSLPVFAISVLSGPLPLRGVTQHGYDVTEGTAILLQEPYFRFAGALLSLRKDEICMLVCCVAQLPLSIPAVRSSTPTCSTCHRCQRNSLKDGSAK